MRFPSNVFAMLPKLFANRSSLTLRLYCSAVLTVAAVILFFAYTLYAQQQLARITREILDKHVVRVQAADKIKHTVLRDEIALFHYLATGDENQIVKGERLGQAALDEIGAFHRLSPSTVVQSRLDVLENDVRRYFSDGQLLIEFAQLHALAPGASPIQAATWAQGRFGERRELEILSEDSERRLARINVLCDELIFMNQREMENARIRMDDILRAGRRDALFAGLVVCLLVLLVAVQYGLFLVRPLRVLIRGVRRVQKGDVDFQIPVRSSDEVGQLTESFNRMTRTVGEQQRLLRHESITDGLTGLYNQRHFRTLLNQEIERSQRSESEFSLLMLDIDHFKQYNDAMGHEFGNDLLKSVSCAIRASLRDIDALARYGGDELSVILPGASAEEAQKLAERIEQAMANQRFVEDKTMPMERLTLSIGGASFPKDAVTLRGLVQQADEALYAAKRSGRACIRWAGTIRQEVI